MLCSHCLPALCTGCCALLTELAAGGGPCPLPSRSEFETKLAAAERKVYALTKERDALK